jgi:hypothetical protein
MQRRNLRRETLLLSPSSAACQMERAIAMVCCGAAKCGHPGNRDVQQSTNEWATRSKAKENEMVEKKDISLEELLAEQSKIVTLATIEAVPEKADFVKVTPWILGSGCMCRFALEVPKKDIASVVLTKHGYPCCGKDLSVVQVEFKESSVLPTAGVFANLSRLASFDLEPRSVRPARGVTDTAAGTSIFGEGRGGRPGNPTDPDGIIPQIVKVIVKFGGCLWEKGLAYGSLNSEQIQACWEQANSGVD